MRNASSWKARVALPTRWPLLLPFVVAAAFASDIPQLKTDGSQSIVIRHRKLNATWLIRFPEAITTPEAYYMHWTPINLEWKRFGEGRIGYQWEASSEWLRRAGEAAQSRGIPVRPGVQVTAEMHPSPNRIDLWIEVLNLTEEPLEDVWSEGGDLQHQTELFIDKDASRTFIRTSRGLTRLSDTHRSRGIRGWYFFDPQWYDAHRFLSADFFWGRSDTRPTSALIASTASDGRGAVGIGYDHSLVLMQNSDQHHCMHSGPFFGTLRPKQKVRRRGVILFGSTVPELFERFDALNYRPDLTPPPPLK